MIGPARPPRQSLSGVSSVARRPRASNSGHRTSSLGGRCAATVEADEPVTFVAGLRALTNLQYGQAHRPVEGARCSSTASSALVIAISCRQSADSCWRQELESRHFAAKVRKSENGFIDRSIQQISQPVLKAAIPLFLDTLRTLLRGLRQDRFFLLLLGALLLFSLALPSRMASYPSLVDWPTMAALTGLLVLTQGLQNSGALRACGECTDKSVPLGKYCLSRPLVFSFDPRCQGLCGSQK